MLSRWEILGALGSNWVGSGLVASGDGSQFVSGASFCLLWSIVGFLGNVLALEGVPVDTDLAQI
eukprot:1915732-Karenia_brevis.AAC.1